MRSIIDCDLVPSIRIQLLVRALFFLFVAVILILAVLLAIRARRKTLRGEKSVEFSIIKEYIDSYRWGFIGLGALCAIISVLLFTDQAIKFFRIMLD
jgi:hypothetical protein